MRKILIKTILLVAMMTFNMLSANNIKVSNVVLTGKNTASGYILVQFDLKWENSWRTASVPGNRDAAWVFIKYRVLPEFGGDGLWKHAFLNNTGHYEGSGTAVALETGLKYPAVAFNSSTNPALGVFFSRNAEGTGSVSISGAKLRWNYGENGVTNSAYVEIFVYALEMVYVPAGAFAAGSGGTEVSAFTLTTINTTDATATPSGSGTLGGQSGGYPTGQTAPASVLWPNGVPAFYIMKYETSQQEYVDFLNTLTYDQQQTRINAAPSSAAGTYAFLNANRSGIRILTPGTSNITPAVFETTLPYVACGYLNYTDGAAFADWTGLRPMTEMEYEKAARGVVVPLANEFPWGSSTVATSGYTLSSSGDSTENIAANFSTSSGNAIYSTTNNAITGPVRVGIFAANPSTTGRISSGASYWGIQEMGGNLTEQVVTLATSAGRSYTGVHGDGTLSTAGNADVSNWPGTVSGEVTGTDGAGCRGGNYSTGATYMRTSDRYGAATPLVVRASSGGFRAVRSIPFICGSTEFKVNHIVGAVAPVSKVATYMTATNIPGQTTKCFITSNLGASQQATSVSDASEASAGWYFQFNRKQGFRHDGTTLTPAWTVTSISESSDWLQANDPCSIEMGSSWRIPSKTEWENMDGATGGNWSNWNGPWNSNMKLHAAGCLGYSNGALINRGTSGYYWSATQNLTTTGWQLFFNSVTSDIENYNKAYGQSVRCLRPWAPEASTTAASSITTVSAASGGTVLADSYFEITARGVCWSTTSGPTIALTTKTSDGTGTGSFTSSITGLSEATTYYVRAYATSSAGTIYGNEITFATTSFVCGTSTITVNHSTSGGVAPVNKTVTYATVTNIPGATTKCWITKNLGATRQATAINDTTEASAGWYWPFNRKQGYYSGYTTTPTWPYSTNYPINENSEWLQANDPCTLEMGGSWRIPTSTEWTNVDASSGGNWTNKNGPWNSNLKIHPAGTISAVFGTPSMRGTRGCYWSSNAISVIQGYFLTFDNNLCGVYANDKGEGQPLRCIK